MHTSHDRHPSTIARVTGLAYLGIIVAGIAAEFGVRAALVDPDDAAATARNIADSPGLFGFGIAADVVMIALDVTVAVGLYRLLRLVDRRRALAASALRLAQGAVLAVNLLALVRALDLARRAVSPDGTILPGLAQEALDAVERHALGYDVGLIAFGLSCLVLGRVLFAHCLVSRPLALGMLTTGGVYLAGSFAAVFAPGMSAVVDPFYVIALVTETAFALRLLVKGLATTPASSDAGSTAPPTQAVLATH